MAENINLSQLDEAQRRDLLHCIERYETIMAALGGTIGRDSVATSEQKNSREYLTEHVPQRMKQYRLIIQGDGQCHWRLCGELLKDLDHLRHSVRYLALGEGLSFFQRWFRRRQFDQKSTQELLDTIERAFSAVAALVSGAGSEGDHRRGLDLLQRNRWADALMELQRAERNFVNLPQRERLNATVLLAIAQIAARNYEEAAKALKKAEPLCAADAQLSKFVRGAIETVAELRSGKPSLSIPTLPLEDVPPIDSYVPLEAKVFLDVFMTKFWKS